MYSLNWAADAEFMILLSFAEKKDAVLEYEIGTFTLNCDENKIQFDSKLRPATELLRDFVTIEFTETATDQYTGTFRPFCGIEEITGCNVYRDCGGTIEEKRLILFLTLSDKYMEFVTELPNSVAENIKKDLRGYYCGKRD